MTKKEALKILYWIVPIQIGAIFLQKNIDPSNKGMVLPIGLIIIGFIIKSYLDQRDNSNFYSELIEENRKIYERMIKQLQEEQASAFGRNIAEIIERTNSDLERREKMRQIQENIDK